MPVPRPSSPRRGFGVWAAILSVTLALLLCFVAIAIVRKDLGVAASAYAQMFWGGFGDFPRFFETGDWTTLVRPWGESATKAAILTFTGLAVAVAFSAGLFNIGAQGQMTVGALAAAFVGARWRLPIIVHPAACLVSAALIGGGYAWLAALLKIRRGVHEVISTIMLNWIAVAVVENWLVVGPLRAHTLAGASRAGTDDIFPSAELPRLLGEISRLHLGFPLAALACAAIWIWLGRTYLGLETRATGLGAEAARASGIPVARRAYQAMGVSGALAGLAGALLVLGTEHKFPATLGAPYGFDGIAIALIGQNHPWGVFVAAIGFGAIRAGGTRMQLLGVHKSFPELIQGLALLFIAGKFIWKRLIEGARGSNP